MQHSSVCLPIKRPHAPILTSRQCPFASFQYLSRAYILQGAIHYDLTALLHRLGLVFAAPQGRTRRDAIRLPVQSQYPALRGEFLTYNG